MPPSPSRYRRLGVARDLTDRFAAVEDLPAYPAGGGRRDVDQRYKV